LSIFFFELPCSADIVGYKQNVKIINKKYIYKIRQRENKETMNFDQVQKKLKLTQNQFTEMD
jgi:hypothetical protein